MVEQVPETDPPPCADATRQERADTVVEAEPALGDELHDERRHEALRDASDPERVIRPSLSPPDLGIARGDDDPLAVLLDERDHARDVARGDEPVGGALKLLLERRGRSDHVPTGKNEADRNEDDRCYG